MDEFDPEALLAALIANDVEFIIIGGLGATLHGAELPTSDLDIVYERSINNLGRLATVLQHLDVRLRGAEDLQVHIDAVLLRNGDSFTFTTRFGPLDILGTPSGAPPYPELRQSAAEYELGGNRILVASLEDLIAMKRTTGRRKDVAKLAELEELRRLQGETPRPAE